MSTPETIRADAREDERYNRDGPLAEQPCDPEFCPMSCWSEDGLFLREINMGSGDTGDYDVTVLCGCEHHEKEG